MPAMRPRPKLTAENSFFWTSGADGKLRILRCRSCAAFIHPPRPLCPSCLTEDLAPEAVPGTGTIVSFTINHQKWRPDLETPYVIARVRLDGAKGIVMTTNIVGTPPESVDLDQKVRVLFEEQDGIFYPLFERVS